MVAGGEEAWRAMPFVSLSNCFVVPPMKFATESCLTMEACIRAGMPILLLSAGQAGRRPPPRSLRPSCRRWPECLAGVVYVNAMAPGHPAVFGNLALRVRPAHRRHVRRVGGTGAPCRRAARRCTGSTASRAGAAGGMTDSKLPDMQAGWEQGIIKRPQRPVRPQQWSMNPWACMPRSWASPPEGMVLGNDLIGQAQRCVRGIDVTGGRGGRST